MVSASPQSEALAVKPLVQAQTAERAQHWECGAPDAHPGLQAEKRTLSAGPGNPGDMRAGR